MQLTHTVLHQVFSCHLGSHESAVKSGTNVFISISVYCHPKHSLGNTILTPCLPAPSAHCWQRENLGWKVRVPYTQPAFWVEMLASGYGHLSPREGLNDTVQEARLLGQSYAALNSLRKVNVSPNEVQLTACSHTALKSIVLIFPL